MHKSMRQNTQLLAARRFDSVDEAVSAAIAHATAGLALASMSQAPAQAGLRITLSGNLGAGKTTWVREFLRACGISGRIKSPSFSVAETYEHAGYVFHHLDFYRQSNPAAWQGGGLRDLLAERAIVLMEWPEQAQGLPPAHIEISIGWEEEADATAPRTLEIHFFEQSDGIALAPHLANWEQAIAQSRGLP
jgi:tRNA threonylcarbamoyladenosine biosynthesis protein TsaE